MRDEFSRSRRDALTVFAVCMASAMLPLQRAQARASGTATAPTLVTFTAIDYAFDGPATMPAGWISFQLINRGKRAHMLGIVRLAGGKSATDVLADTLADPSGPLPDYVTDLGGPAAVDPGGIALALVNLASGSYAVLCEMPDGNSGQSHLARGMIRPFTVLAPATQATPPAAAVTLSATEFSYGIDVPISAGHQVVHFQNTGQQQHEAQLARLPDGVTVDQYIALNDATSASAGSSYGGSSSIPPGGDDYFAADFEPGRYAAICFATDPASGKSHFELGQIMEFSVQ